MQRIITSAALALGFIAASAGAQAEKEKPRETKSEQPRANKGKLKLVDLNTATEAELRQIPGVDKAMAKKIMDNRPYITVEDLARSGIPVEVQRSAEMRVTVTPQTPASETGTADRKESKQKTEKHKSEKHEK